MKKLLVFVFLLTCLGCTTFFKLETNPLFNLNGVDRVCFISSVALDKTESVNCGDMVFNYCSLSTAKENLSDFKEDLIGVEFYFDESVNLDEILTILKAEIISQFESDNLVVLSAYTPYYQDCVYVNGKKVNVQIAISGGCVIAGFPMLLTGY